MRCKTRLSISRPSVPATGSVRLVLGTATVEVLIRSVDAAGAPTAFSVAVDGSESAVFHLAAGEAWHDERMELAEPLALVVAATAGDRVEVARWEG